MVQVVRCLVEFAKADLATAIASFKTLSSILQPPRGASGCKELEKQVQDINNHQASAIMRTLLHESRDPEGEPGRSSKQYVQVNPAVQTVQGQDVNSALLCRAARAFHLIEIVVANNSFASKLQGE